MSKWEKYKLGEVINLKRGYDLPQQKRVNGNIPIFSSAGISGYHNEYKQKGPGVITGRYGTLGELFYTEENYWPHNTTLYVTDFKGNFPKFIYYFLKTLRLDNQNDKTSVPGLNRNHLHEIEVKIPKDFPTQSSIASILSSLDDKIELNRRMNQTLEQMAQALFNHYFVDNIDPENLPEGWKNVKLKDCLELLKDGSHNPPKRKMNGIKFIAGATNIKDLIIDFSKSTYISKSEYDKIHKNWEVTISDILLTIVGTIGNVAFVREGDLPFSLQRSIAILRPNELICKSYLYLQLKSKAFRSYINSHSNRTAQPGIYLGTLSDFPMFLPPKNIMFQFDTEVSLIIERMLLNASETETLSTLRDTLLPKLMSGEIDVDSLLTKEEQPIENLKTA